MPFIHLTTFIAAPAERVFDLSRSVSLHKYSMSRYDESIIDGTISGLMDKDQTVTWKARHLLKNRTIKVKISQLERPAYFLDEQVQGPFQMMKHEHYFKPIENGTIMIDQFWFEIPRGMLGRLINRLYLEKYMVRLLNERNEIIKKVAEGNQWKQYLS